MWIEAPTCKGVVLINFDHIQAVDNNEGLCDLYFSSGVTNTSIQFSAFQDFLERNNLLQASFEEKTSG